jgi:DNA-binding transcriptional LysR family regulator
MKLSTIDLRLFAAIADHAGITAAARHLGLTKSLVSRELAALESRLQTRLVQRTTRHVSLTESGELLAEYARRVVEELNNAEAAIEATRDVPRGDLKVTAPFSILRFVLTPRLAEFRAAYPGIRLLLDASLRVADLVDENIDVAIRTGPLPSSSLVARQLAEVPIHLMAAPEYLSRRGAPKQPADLGAHDIVNLRASVAPETWTLHRERAGAEEVRVKPVVAVFDPGLVIDLARQGHGIAPVPVLYVRHALQDGSLVRVLPQWHRGSVPVHAIYPSRRILAPKVRAFVDFAADAMRDTGPGWAMEDASEILRPKPARAQRRTTKR